MKRFPTFLLIAAFAYEILILYLSVQRVAPTRPVFAGQDKVIHFAAFAFLGLLLMLAGILGGRGYFYAGGVLAGVFLGIVTEFLQSWVPSRIPSFFDALANLLGLLLVIAVYETVHLWKKGGIIYAETLPPSPKKDENDAAET